MKQMQQHTYEHIDFPPLTDEQKKELEELDAMSDDEIDFSDIPPSEPNSNGGFYYKQNSEMPKTTLRALIDNDMIVWLQSAGKSGYQRKMNNVLRWAKEKGCPIAQM